MPNDSKQSVLITGANGFVGSRLCRVFLSAGFHVVAGIRENCDRSMINDLDLEYRYGDITLPETLPAMVEGVDYIVQNAGVTKVKKIETFYNVNHFGVRNIARAALAESNLKKFVLISSLAAAGPSQPGNPIDESAPPHPITEYGKSKLAGEHEILSFADKLNVAAVRPPAIYGPGDKEVFTFFETVRKGIRPLMGNLDRKIQMVHVDDLCRGVLRTVLSDTESGAIYFIAESKSYTYRELVGYISDAVGRKGIPLRIPGGPVKLIGSIFEKIVKAFGGSPMFTREKAEELLANWEMDLSKAKNELGYESAIPFGEGSKQTAAWYRERGWL